jgi:hypothetical protein
MLQARKRGMQHDARHIWLSKRGPTQHLRSPDTIEMPD